LIRTQLVQQSVPQSVQVPMVSAWSFWRRAILGARGMGGAPLEATGVAIQRMTASAVSAIELGVWQWGRKRR
jgi:hypothetical protein